MASVAVLSHIVVDEVYDANRRLVGEEVGGAGAYAAAGASLAEPEGATFLVSGIGSEDRPMLLEWCRRRRISSDGLFVVGAESPRTRIQYFADGGREETPVHGLGHFRDHTPLPRHIPVDPGRLDGVYLFHDHDLAYWEEIADLRRPLSGPLLWEISLDSCRPEHLDDVRDRLALADLLSINEAEALSLLGATRIEDAVEWFRGVDATVLLRRGEQGSMIVGSGRTHLIGISPTLAIDPTGGGNSYGGGFLAVYARTGDPVQAGRTAAATAGAVVSAPGAPEIDEERCRSVQRAAESVVVEHL